MNKYQYLSKLSVLVPISKIDLYQYLLVKILIVIDINISLKILIVIVID